MTTLIKRDNQSSYAFEYAYSGLEEKVLICGNHRLKSFGDSKLLDIINNDYYDDDTGYEYDTIEELEKVTGHKYEEQEIRGCVQRDWQTIYIRDYEDVQVKIHIIEELEAFYFGLYDTYYCVEEDCYYDVPNYVTWRGKKAICEYLGFIEEKTTVKGGEDND